MNHECSSTDPAVLHFPACIVSISSIPWSPKLGTWQASIRSPTKMRSQGLDHGYLYNPGRTFLVCPAVSTSCLECTCCDLGGIQQTKRLCTFKVAFKNTISVFLFLAASCNCLPLYHFLAHAYWTLVVANMFWAFCSGVF